MGLPLLPRNEIVDHSAAQGTRAVQRVQRDEVVETLRLGLAQDVAHARALELEDAVGRALAKNLIGLRLVERDGGQVQGLTGRTGDLIDGVLEQRQRAEPEEVHLQQAHALDFLHGPLRRDFVAGALVERRELDDRLGGDHDTGGMDRRVSRHPL